MNLRIIAGKWGGRKLDFASNGRTHPMSERARGAMFNSLAGKIEGASVLDAFAGTGAIGLEALSRGAKNTTFIERDRIAQKIIKNNITNLHAEDQAKLVNSSLAGWINTNSEPLEFDLIFADPPYHDLQFSTVAKLFSLLRVGGTMILSHPDRREVPIKQNIVVVDNRSYGTVHLTSYRRQE